MPSRKKSREMRKKAEKYLMTSTHSSYPFIPDPTRAQGVELWDVDGNRYLDFCSGAGVSNLGHNHPVVREAVRKQAASGFWQYDANVFPNLLAIELAEKLASLTPGNFEKKVFFSNSGTEANEAAVKLLVDPKLTTVETAMDILISTQPHRTHFVFFEGAFHGRTGYTIPLLGSKEVARRHYPLAYPAHSFPFPSYSTQTRRMFSTYFEFRENWMKLFQSRLFSLVSSREIGGVFLELIQGEGGVNVADRVVVEKLARFCEQYEIPLVIDEVQTGICRTGKMFASEHYGLTPQVITLAKGLSSGAVPCGATIFDAKLDFGAEGRHSNTNGGNALAMSAALATLRVCGTPWFPGMVQSSGRYLRGGLEELGKKFNRDSKGKGKIGEIRGLGLMLGMDFVRDLTNQEPYPNFTHAFLNESYESGLLLLLCGTEGVTSAVRFMPPLVITHREIDEALVIIEKALNRASKKLSRS